MEIFLNEYLEMHSETRDMASWGNTACHRSMST